MSVDVRPYATLRPATHAASCAGRRRSIPKERYTSREFLDLEMERLWSRVWQVACREEEIAATRRLRRVHDRRPVGPGRADRDPTTITGVLQRLPAPGHAPRPTGAGNFADGDDPLPLPRVALRARRPARRRRRPRRVRDRCPTASASPTVRVDSLGRLRVRQPRPRRRAAARLPRSAPEAARAVPPRRDAVPLVPHDVLPANWKVVVDAFNEAYHVQGTHPQLLPWTDDVEHRVRAVRHARALRTAAERAPQCCGRARVSASTDDESTRARSSRPRRRARWRVPEGRARARRRLARGRTPPAPAARGRTRSAAWQLLASRGFDVSGFEPDR